MEVLDPAALSELEHTCRDLAWRLSYERDDARRRNDATWVALEERWRYLLVLARHLRQIQAGPVAAETAAADTLRQQLRAALALLEAPPTKPASEALPAAPERTARHPPPLVPGPRPHSGTVGRDASRPARSPQRS